MNVSVPRCLRHSAHPPESIGPRKSKGPWGCFAKSLTINDGLPNASDVRLKPLVTAHYILMFETVAACVSKVHLLRPCGGILVVYADWANVSPSLVNRHRRGFLMRAADPNTMRVLHNHGAGYQCRSVSGVPTVRLVNRSTGKPLTLNDGRLVEAKGATYPRALDEACRLLRFSTSPATLKGGL